jgi:hypothetical protein
MTYVSDREAVEAAIRADRTAPTKARRNEALAELVPRADQEFAGVAGYSDLTDVRRQQLFKALLDAKRHFDSRKNIKATPKDSASIALLAKVEKSIKMVAEFGDNALKTPDVLCGPSRPATPQGHKASRLLEEAGEQWARQHREAGGELPSGFPQSWEAAQGFTHYGADDFIESFLRSARVMQSIIEMAQAPPARPGIEGRAANLQNSLTDWLVGEKLPEIYSNTFGISFTATPKSDYQANTSNGIKFVRAACLAMGLPDLAKMSDNTIKVHYQNVRKGSSLGAD